MSYPRAIDGTPVTTHRVLQLGQSKFLRTDDGSASMCINGEAGGADVVLWNGTGGSDTGGDWTAGGTGSETAGSMHSGTNGWDTGVTSKDGVTTFDNGSEADVDGTYSSMHFWMNPRAFPNKSELHIEWRNAADAKIGVTLNIEDYVTSFDTDAWQQVDIPMPDFALTADVQKLVFTFAKSAGQDFYFDDIHLHTSGGGGGPYSFQIAAPDATKQYHVSMISLLISGDSTGWNATTFANTTALTNGLLLRQRMEATGVTSWSINSKDNVDLFGRFHPQDDITFADGTMLVGFMIKPGMASIVITDCCVLEFVVRDDLSALTTARAFVHYGIEDLT